MYTTWKNSVKKASDAEYDRNTKQTNENPGTVHDGNCSIIEPARPDLIEAHGPKADVYTIKTNVPSHVHALGKFRVKIDGQSPINPHAPTQIHSPAQVDTAPTSISLNDQQVHNEDDHMQVDEDIGRKIKEQYFSNASAVIIVVIH